MSSNSLKRQRNKLLKDNKSLMINGSFISNNDEDLDNDELPTKIKIKTNDITKYLSTSDNQINDLLHQIDKLKQHIHHLEEQSSSTTSKDDNEVGIGTTPLLTIKYKNSVIADKYNDNVFIFLNNTFKSDNDVKYNIRCNSSSIEVHEEKINKKPPSFEVKQLIHKIDNELSQNNKLKNDDELVIAIDNVLPTSDNDLSQDDKLNDNDEPVIIIDNISSQSDHVDKIIAIDNELSQNDEPVIIKDNVLSQSDNDKEITIDNKLPQNDKDESVINIDSTLSQSDNDEQMIVLDNELSQNDNDAKVIMIDNVMCLDTTPNKIIEKDNSDYRYELLPVEDDDDDDNMDKKKLKGNSSTFSCFNCGDNGSRHNLKDCPHPKNWERISQARKKFKEQMNSSNQQRYHVNDDDKYASLKPGGELSKNLRHALGLRSNEVPLHIYKMRLLGYPPGWYQELVHGNTNNNTSGSASSILNVFTYDNTSATNTTDNVLSSSENIVEESMLIDYPGFNIPLKRNMKDEHWKYNVPAIQDCQNKYNFLKYLNQFNTINNSSTINNVINNVHQCTTSLINNYTNDNVINITDDDNDEISNVEMEIIPNEEPPIMLSTCNNINEQEPITCNNKNNGNNHNHDSNHSSDNSDDNTSSSVSSRSSIETNKLSTDGGLLTRPSTSSTPMLTKVSSFTALPKVDKFSKDMCPLMNFENLSDYIGTYDKMKGLLDKVKTKLKDIHSTP